MITRIDDDLEPAEAGPPLDGVLFDMDGVVTDTAAAHAAAWKRLFDEFLAGHPNEAPFDADAEYRRYVDGKPRYDGVASFLASRGLDLPRGEPSDPPGSSTVCALGNRKNEYFQAWLRTERAFAYPGAIRLIRSLRAARVPVAVFSSSRNAAEVLRSAGVADLFDARVDGLDLDREGMQGKPAPGMLLEAARRIGVAPQRAAVIEDAESGVRAGAAGGFGLVIGVNRGSGAAHAAALGARGADVVINALSELRWRRGTLEVKTPPALPTVWDKAREIHARLRTGTPAFFLDYDGTLTPIVENYWEAHMPPDTREAVRRLMTRHRVAFVSGRDLGDLRGFVQIAGASYAGSHGFEIALPDGRVEHVGGGDRYLDALAAAERELREGLAAIRGHAVERKAFDVAVHYRRVADGEVADVERVVDEVVARHPTLRKGGGKKVFEVQPDANWHKGQAVGWLIARLAADVPDLVPVYIGDDLTDENAFRALPPAGFGIVVGDTDRTTSADYRLADPDDVRRFLAWLLEDRETP